MNKDLLNQFRRIKCVYCDINGTIIRDDNKISVKTKKIFQKLMNSGYIFGLISSLHPSTIMMLFDELKPNGLCVGLNGALITDSDQRIIFCQAITNQLIRNLISELMQKNHAFFLLEGNIVYYYSGKNKEYRQLILPYVNSVNFSSKSVELNDNDLSLRTFSQVLFLTIINNKLEPEIDQIIKQFQDDPSINIYRDSNFLEIKPMDTDKGWALEQVAQFYRLPLESIMVFGDSYNDLAMFKKAGIAIAMKQAPHDIKKSADYVTDFSNNDDGVADFIEKYLLNETLL